jgi:hypothetical protein
MLNDIIRYANIIVGILIFLVGFIFHWIGQLISILDWNYATKLGLQEKKMLPKYTNTLLPSLMSLWDGSMAL